MGRELVTVGLAGERGKKIDRTRHVIKAAFMQRTLERTVKRSITFRAPHLLPLVRLWLRLSEHPDDRAAYIQLRLLQKSCVDRCPRCQSRLTVAGYSRTEAPYMESERLACGSCETTYVLREKHVS